jgi:alkylation response protein AidB-like acyl-CoA dehydrogenase
MALPAEYGGGGASFLATAVAIEELSRVDAVAGVLVAAQTLGGLPVALAGDPGQRARFLPPLARGEHLPAFALTEPEAGSDVAGIRTTARRNGDAYVLNGSKHFITNAGVARLHVVFARAPEGIAAFLVESGTPGLRLGRIHDKMGLRGSVTGELIFEGAEVPAGNRLGAEGEGLRIALATLDRTRTNVAAQALGIAQGALDLALGHARSRRQFGRPIAEFQGIQFMLADMAIQVEAARRLLYAACERVDEEAARGARLSPEAGRLSASAKCFCSDTAMKVTTDAVQVLGGYGYMKDHPAERMMRDAKITQIYEGTNQIQRWVVARALLGG